MFILQDLSSNKAEMSAIVRLFNKYKSKTYKRVSLVLIFN